MMRGGQRVAGWGLGLKIYGEKSHDVRVRKERERVQNDRKQD